MEHADKLRGARRTVWLFFFTYIATYVHLLLVVNPRLIYQNQQPTFYTDVEYIQKHLAYPGGFAEYCADFLAQFYLFPWLGAAVLTLVIAAIALSACAVYHTFHLGAGALYITIMVTGALVALHSGYFYNLAYSLAIVFSLIAFFIFIYFRRKSLLSRLLLYVLLCLSLYFFVAAPFFIFVLLCVFAELFTLPEKRLRKLFVVLFYVLIALVWPFVAHSMFFLYNRSDVYAFLLPFRVSMPIAVLPEGVYLLLLAPPLVSGIVSLIRKKNHHKKPHHRKIRGAQQGILPAILTIALVTIIYRSVDIKHKVFLTIDKFAEEHDWKNITATATAHPNVLHRLLTFHYNRALYHQGKLCEELFAYPQLEGENGLYYNSGAAFEAPYAMASLTYEMGNINSAQCWANEAFSVEGESARVLKLLTLIHLRKGEDDAAALHSNKLSKMLFQQKKYKRDKHWTDELAKIASAPDAGIVDSSLVSSNFLFRYGHAYAELQYFRARFPQNRMAFEYTLAYALLSRRLDRLVDLVPHFMQMPFEEMPRHLEEALILIGMSGIDYNIDLNAFNFRVDYVEKFSRFMSIISKHNNNTQYAQAELLRNFGDTYWYFHLYHQPKELK